MTGLVRREGLIDVSELDGSSIREKQGQRKCVNSFFSELYSLNKWLQASLSPLAL